MKKEILGLKKLEPEKPNWEESDFAKTLEGQIAIELKRSVIEKHYIESVLLSWSELEQILLPKLLNFVANRLKVELPKDIENSNTKYLNLIYYSLSHDKDLFSRLEKGRVLRNKIIHKLYKEKNITSIKKMSKETCIYILAEIHKPIMDRLTGKVLIPSINLYGNGWNDALSKILKVIKEMK